jgi:hypothetical protein
VVAKYIYTQILLYLCIYILMDTLLIGSDYFCDEDSDDDHYVNNYKGKIGTPIITHIERSDLQNDEIKDGEPYEIHTHLLDGETQIPFCQEYLQIFMGVNVAVTNRHNHVYLLAPVYLCSSTEIFGDNLKQLLSLYEKYDNQSIVHTKHHITITEHFDE